MEYEYLLEVDYFDNGNIDYIPCLNGDDALNRCSSLRKSYPTATFTIYRKIQKINTHNII